MKANMHTFVVYFILYFILFFIILAIAVFPAFPPFAHLHPGTLPPLSQSVPSLSSLSMGHAYIFFG